VNIIEGQHLYGFNILDNIYFIHPQKIGPKKFPLAMEIVPEKPFSKKNQ
jgi:hypothetical protein